MQALFCIIHEDEKESTCVAKQCPSKSCVARRAKQDEVGQILCTTSTSSKARKIKVTTSAQRKICANDFRNIINAKYDLLHQKFLTCLCGIVLLTIKRKRLILKSILNKAQASRLHERGWYKNKQKKRMGRIQERAIK